MVPFRHELVPLVLMLLIHSSECFRLLPLPHISVLRLAAKNEGKQYNERPIQKLQRTFETSMIDPKVPLLRDFDTYAKTLPTRSYGEADYHMRLADCHFYARDEQFELMISQIQDHRVNGDRGTIPYISSRSCSGKSASVLNLFLYCVEKGVSFGLRKVHHYFHMAFNNNDGNYFKYTGIVSAIDGIACDQGAAYIFEAIKRLVEFPGDYSSIEVQDSPREQKETKELLQAYIDETFPGIKYILVHIDEHAKLCERSDAFRKGVWNTLAEVKRLIVLASYVQIPNELNSVTMYSSEVCAGPVTAVLVDLLSMVKHMPELAGLQCIGRAGNDREEERLLSTFRFRLACWFLEKKRLSRIQGLAFLRDDSISLSEYDKDEILYASYTIKQEIEVIAKFADQGDIVKASNLCRPRLAKKIAMLDHAAALLIGIDPKSVGSKGHIKVESGVVLPNGMISTDIMILLNAREDISASSAAVFESGCRRLRSILAKDLSGDNLLDTPLEAVYAWVLGVQAATKGSLRLPFKRLLFQCKDIRAGRILKTDDMSSFSPGKLAPDGTSIQKYVLYHVDEDGIHPAADLFFLTDCGTKLVLVGVTGGKYNAAIKRKRRLQSFIDLYKEQCQVVGVDLKCIGIVLAPLAEDESGGAGKADDVNILYKEDARDLMGAFAQHSEWFVDLQ